MKKKKFSLVTTCRNEIESVHRWKQNIHEQTRQPYEIVVVDAFSDDGTAEVLKEWAGQDDRVKLYQYKGNAAFGRNRAINHASYDIILSTDMGVRLADVWCEELIIPFEKDVSVDVVAGNTCIDKETAVTAAARAEYYIENGEEPRLGPGFVPGNRSVAYKKSIWEQLGGLPEDLTFYADDSVFGRQMLQANLKIAYAPKAMTYWGRPKILRDFWKEQFNYGKGDGEALIKMSYAFKLYLKNIIPFWLAPFLNGLRVVQKQTKLKSYLACLRNADLPALFLMPVLSFGNGWHFVKGYKIGYDKGEIQCVEVRNRLSQEYR